MPESTGGHRLHPVYPALRFQTVSGTSIVTIWLIAISDSRFSGRAGMIPLPRIRVMDVSISVRVTRRDSLKDSLSHFIACATVLRVEWLLKTEEESQVYVDVFPGSKIPSAR
jgi:hypothetical protein